MGPEKSNVTGLHVFNIVVNPDVATDLLKAALVKVPKLFYCSGYSICEKTTLKRFHIKFYIYYFLIYGLVFLNLGVLLKVQWLLRLHVT